MTSTEADPVPLGHGITLIPLPNLLPRLKWTNAYAVEGPDGVALIDCSIDSDEAWAALGVGLRAIGRSIADVTTLVGTHLHFDHVGLAGRIVEASGARFVMHSAALAGIRDYDDWSRQARKLADLASHSGAPEDEVAELSTPLPRPPWIPRAAVPSDLVEDGASIDIGGDRALEVLHTPGHEPAHICLVDSRTGVLFSGDHVLPRITPVVPYAENEDRLGTYTESLRRIEDLAIGLTYPAHGAILERGSLRARQIILHHERRLGGIVQELRHGPATAWEIMEAIFRPNLMAVQKRLAFSETMAHLAHLREREEIDAFAEDGVTFYRIPPRRP